MLLLALAGCSPTDSGIVQGYVEGEYVYVSSAVSGALESLYVQRGSQVKAGDQLFTLDSTPERAARNEAERRLAQARANLEDAKKGRRPSEIESIKAQLEQAQAALELSENEFLRQTALFKMKVNTAQDVERVRSLRDQSQQRVIQLTADLETAQLGARSDQIDAAEANVRMMEAALARADWDLSQTQQNAPQAGVVFDTLYRQGEWVAAGRPVVAVLPPANIKVRAFVPEAQIGGIQLGQHVSVTVDGAGQPLTGTVSFISPKAEFTPPVIYSRESRSKLVFMIEATFEAKDAEKLHPGQPVDVRIVK